MHYQQKSTPATLSVFIARKKNIFSHIEKKKKKKKTVIITILFYKRNRHD